MVGEEIRLKLLEILNNSDFNEVLKEQGISETEDIIVEVKLNSNKSEFSKLPEDQVGDNQAVIARIKRHCPCRPTDPPNGRCCYR